MNIYIICPHCDCIVEIESVNCGIFRHGIYKSSYKQIDAHMPKELCEKIIIEKLIYGCGKPFRIIFNNEKYNAIPCDYI